MEKSMITTETIQQTARVLRQLVSLGFTDEAFNRVPNFYPIRATIDYFLRYCERHNRFTSEGNRLSACACDMFFRHMRGQSVALVKLGRCRSRGAPAARCADAAGAGQIIPALTVIVVARRERDRVMVLLSVRAGLRAT